MRHELTRENSGETLKVSVGDDIFISLTEIATAGYMWSHDKDHSDVIAFVGMDIKTEDHDPKSMRCGGSAGITLKESVIGKGKYELCLTNCRLWDKTDVADTFKLSIESL